MATTSFVADVNKTVTIEGETYTLTLPTIPEGVTVTINETQMQAGVPVELTENATLGISVADTGGSFTVNYTNANSVTYNNSPVTNGQTIDVTGDENTLTFTGATTIPSVTVNGNSITAVTVNEQSIPISSLPYTFTPIGGITNQVFFEGSDTGSRQITIAGTNIATVTVNDEEVQLPYTTTVTEALTIAASGEIYQVDLTSLGGAKITKDGEVINDGNSSLHQIIDIDKDTYLTIDGTHSLTVTGENIESISVNGIVYPVTSLPITVTNNKISATVNVDGYSPSEVHVVGSYMETVTVDGVDIPIGENGSVDFELTTVQNNHFINIQGSQPREYAITWNDNGTTTLYMDGAEQTSGTTSYIEKDVYIEALHDPIPVHIESAPDVITEVNGRDYNSNDFTVNISQATEIDITTATCDLTIDYGDNSFNITVPQSVVTVTAPHRDGWIFDSWSSSDIGIESPKNVRTLLNLQGHNRGHLVCHYQRYCTINKPNSWN